MHKAAILFKQQRWPHERGSTIPSPEELQAHIDHLTGAGELLLKEGCPSLSVVDEIRRLLTKLHGENRSLNEFPRFAALVKGTIPDCQIV